MLPTISLLSRFRSTFEQNAFLADCTRLLLQTVGEIWEIKSSFTVVLTLLTVNFMRPRAKRWYSLPEETRWSRLRPSFPEAILRRRSPWPSSTASQTGRCFTSSTLSAGTVSPCSTTRLVKRWIPASFWTEFMQFYLTWPVHRPGLITPLG